MIQLRKLKLQKVEVKKVEVPKKLYGTSLWSSGQGSALQQGDLGLIPGQGVNILRAAEQLTPHVLEPADPKCYN